MICCSLEGTTIKASIKPRHWKKAMTITETFFRGMRAETFSLPMLWTGQFLNLGSDVEEVKDTGL